MRYIIACSIMFLTACASPGLSLKTWSVDNGESLSIDAKQRIVINTDQAGPDHDHRVVCAEASPDVFIALGTGVDANVSGLPTGSLKGSSGLLHNSVNETAANLTNRTQAIQLLRDSLYRACEAYSNGAIGKDEYRRIIVSYDDVLVVLVALSIISEPAFVNPSKTGQAGQTGLITASEAAEPVPVPNPESNSARDIIRDYYCYQIGIKEIDVSPEIVNKLCHSE